MTENEQNHIFEDWLNLYRALIFKVVRAHAFSAMDRDDLFQEITIQVWHSIPTFRQESAVTTWIYRIALNTAIKWLRKERKYQESEMIGKKQYVLEDLGPPVNERLTWLYHEIYKLDEIDRCVTILLLDSLSYREMAEILGISESNVGVRINRIKKQLASKSKKYVHHGI